MNIISFGYLVVRSLPCCPASRGIDARSLLVADDRDDGASSGGERSAIGMEYYSPDGERTQIGVTWSLMRKHGIHFGQLRPRGLIGALANRLYWLVFYVCLAVPGAISFVVLRKVSGAPHGHMTSFVAFTDAIRAVALVPQLYMHETRKTRRISEQLLFFVLCEGLLKIVALLFWTTYPLFQYTSDVNNAGRYYGMFVQLVNLLMVVRFLSVLCNPSVKGSAIEKAIEMNIPLSQSSNKRPIEGAARNRVLAR